MVAAVFRVVGHHEQDVHALGEEVLGLGVLQGVVAVGRLHEDLAPRAPPRLHDQVAVALPALLLEGVHGEADGDLLLAAAAPPAGALPPPPPPPQAASVPHTRTKDAKRNLAMRTLPCLRGDGAAGCGSIRSLNARRVARQPTGAEYAFRPVKVETLFLDAGGVLVNPNFDRVAEALRAHGVPAEGAALRGAEAHAKKELDTDSTVNATNDSARGWLYFELC